MKLKNFVLFLRNSIWRKMKFFFMLNLQIETIKERLQKNKVN